MWDFLINCRNNGILFDASTNFYHFVFKRQFLLLGNLLAVTTHSMQSIVAVVFHYEHCTITDHTCGSTHIPFIYIYVHCDLHLAKYLHTYHYTVITWSYMNETYAHISFTLKNNKNVRLYHSTFLYKNQDNCKLLKWDNWLFSNFVDKTMGIAKC